MPDRRDDDYIFCRLSCGIIGFIFFYMATFISFILAEEPDGQYESAMIIGFAMLIPTFAFFCCVWKDSMRIERIGGDPSLEMQLLLPNEHDPDDPEQLPAEPQQLPIQPAEIQAEPQQEAPIPQLVQIQAEPQQEAPIPQLVQIQAEPQQEAPTEPHREDPTSDCLENVRSSSGLPGSGREIDSEGLAENDDKNNSGFGIQKLIEMTKSVKRKILRNESGKVTQDKDSARCKDATMISSEAGSAKADERRSTVAEPAFIGSKEQHYSQVGLPKATGKRLETSDSVDPPVKEISYLSLSDSAKQPIKSFGTKETEKVSEELSKLSLSEPEKKCPDLRYVDE